MCALDDDRRVECWSLYRDEEESLQADVREALAGVQFTAIDAGGTHVCGLRDDQGILCWGNGDAGLLDAPTGQSFKHIAAGIGHSCALTTEGAAVCWGDDSFGQSTPPEDARFSSLSAGELHTCGLQADGTALCWGSDVDDLVSPPPGVAFDTISASSDHTCGLTATGEAHCWGSDAYGQLTPPPALARFTRLFTDWVARRSGGPVRSCGLREDGLARCWGAGDDPSVPVLGGSRFTEIAISDELACGLLLNGTATCWRRNTEGPEPRLDGVVANVPSELTFTAIVIAGNRPCGLTSERFIHCWDADQDGYSQDVPPPSGKYIALASNESHACAVNDAGRIRCLDGAYRFPKDLEQLVRPYRGITSIGEHFGASDTLSRKYQALALGDGSRYRSGGSERSHFHACALTESGAAVCWGADHFGQASPPEGVRFSSIAAGGRHTCGVTLEGPTRCWGADDAGQSTPPTRDVLSDLRADHDSTCGLRADGEVVCWGDHNLPTAAQLVPFEINLPPWHSADFMELDRLGVIRGTECTTRRFCTDAPLSRAALAVWLDRLVGPALPAAEPDAAASARWDSDRQAPVGRPAGVAPDATTLRRWDDVAAGVWWAGHARRLVAAEVMQPCDAANRTFCPNDPVARAELELILERALHARAKSGPQATGAGALTNAAAAVGADVFSMCVDRSPEVCHAGAVTRGQAATVLNRLRRHIDRLDRPEFTSASGAGSGGCGSRADGSVECWGRDWTGETYVLPTDRVLDVYWDGTMWCGSTVAGYPVCGGWDGGYGHTHVLASVDSALQGEAVIGLRHSCALLDDQSVECITATSIGAGPGPILDPNVPEGKFTAVAVGVGHSCALKLDGSPVCWGGDDAGETSPPRDARYTALALGALHSCGLRADGTAECWGYDEDGRLTPPPTPYGVEAPDASVDEQAAETTPLAFKDIAAGISFTCGLTLDGLLACWGDLERTQPPADVVGQEFTSITAVGTYVCVKRPDGRKRCWGSGAFRRSLDVDAGFVEVSANEELTCGRRTDGSVQCWGDGLRAPPPNTPGRQGFTWITTGSGFACGRKKDGAQQCWPLDAEREVPAGVAGEDFVQLSDSGLHLCILRSDGTIACWGGNHNGEAAPPDGEYVQMAVGAVSAAWWTDEPDLGQTCAVDASGAIHCWGDDSYGQSTPPAGNDFVKVAVSGVHACGLHGDGRIECWGQGLRRGEGPSSEQRYSDVVVGADGIGAWGPQKDDEGRTRYSAHTCGLRIDGIVDCWGSVYTPNKPYNRHEPDPNSRFTSISSGGSHVCGVRTDGAIECWGIPAFIAY